MKRQSRWNPYIFVALLAAAILLAVGVLMAIYQERLYSDQQVKSVREQAQILATSATAAIQFGQVGAAQEYVDAFRANPELLGAAMADRGLVGRGGGGGGGRKGGERGMWGKEGHSSFHRTTGLD